MKSKLKRAVSLVLVAGIALSAAGCWDRIEINERIFVLGLVIDKFEPGKDVQAGEDGAEQQEEGAEQPGKAPEPFGGKHCIPQRGAAEGEGPLCRRMPSLPYPR